MPFLLRVLFLYFSGMTYVFLFVTFTVNPGYIPNFLKLPVTNKGLAPMRIVRIYNMRTWLANGIYKFEQFAPNSDLEINFDKSTEISETGKEEVIPKFITP